MVNYAMLFFLLPQFKKAEQEQKTEVFRLIKDTFSAPNKLKFISKKKND